MRIYYKRTQVGFNLCCHLQHILITERNLILVPLFWFGYKGHGLLMAYHHLIMLYLLRSHVVLWLDQEMSYGLSLITKSESPITGIRLETILNNINVINISTMLKLQIRLMWYRPKLWSVSMHLQKSPPSSWYRYALSRCICQDVKDQEMTIDFRSPRLRPSMIVAKAVLCTQGLS